MVTISINASSCYDVSVGSGLLINIADRIRAVTHARQICIVSDETVWSLWGNIVLDALRSGGYACCSFVLPQGEEQKIIENCTKLWEYLAENEFDRQDCLLALGGGVVGDLTGFAAATYLRGIDYIQVPTTLLAMVDSSVGGKTAINLKAGKNLVGAFHQPKLVLCDIDTLSTLPVSVFLNGCGEVIKYAALFDPELFADLETSGPDFSRESVISRCISHKARVVETDEMDRGERMLLNLGHTLGHAFEALSGYQMPHGQAVAAGMACVCRSTAADGMLSMQVCNRTLALLEKFSLPVTSNYSLDSLLSAMEQDKKRNADVYRLVIVEDIGRCSIVSMNRVRLESFIQKGLSYEYYHSTREATGKC